VLLTFTCTRVDATLRWHQFPPDTPKAAVSVHVEAVNVRVTDSQFQAVVAIGSGLSSAIKHTSQFSAHCGLRPRATVFEVGLAARPKAGPVLHALLSQLSTSFSSRDGCLMGPLPCAPLPGAPCVVGVRRQVHGGGAAGGPGSGQAPAVAGNVRPGSLPGALHSVPGVCRCHRPPNADQGVRASGRRVLASKHAGIVARWRD